MKKLLLAFLFGLCAIVPSQAQRVQQPLTAGVVCRYNATPPTLTDGWFGYAQCDNTGKLIVSGAGGGSAGAVYGPNAIGIAPTQPPILVGGTADGTAAGVINPWKVGTGGIGFINCSNCSGSGISVAFAGAIGSVGTPGGFKDGSGNFQALLGDVTNGLWTSVKASVLPTGASTETTLSALNIKIPAQGQALSAASIPVVLPAAQITTLTPPAAITGFATAAKQPALGTAGTPSADIISVQGAASMTPIAGNITQVLGTANSATNGLFVRTGSGQIASGSFASGAVSAGAYASGAGVDGWDLTQGAIADAVVAAGASGSVSAKLRRLTTDMDAAKTSLASIDTKASASVPVTLNGTPTAQTGLTPSATATTPQTGTVVAANTDQSSVGGSAIFADPCQRAPHVYTRVDVAAAASSVLVAGTASKKTFICSMMLFAAGTTNVGIVEGSGTTCGTSPLGLIGGNTAAKGPNLTAQAGFVAGQGGFAIAGTTVNANDICLIISAAIQVSGYIVTATPTP